MALFNVPQFIDIEDKIIGPFTAKQIGWMAGGGVLLFILYNMLDASAFILSAIVVSGVFGALAFYRPYNQPLIKFILSSVHFSFRPKIYVWKRNLENFKTSQKAPQKKKAGEGAPQKKTIDSKKISEISKILDSR